MEYDFNGLREDLEEDGTCVPCLSLFHSHRTSPPPLRHSLSGRGREVGFMSMVEQEDFHPAVSSVWDFAWPTTSTMIPSGDPNDPSMQAAAALQWDAEREYATATNRELLLKLRLRNFALDVYKDSIQKLNEKVALQQAELETCKKRLEEFERKEEAQNRLSQEIWGPMPRRGDMRDTSTWDTLPVLLDSPASKDFLDSPLILTHVAQEMGFTCRPSELRRLTTSVYDAYLRAHGHAPTPKIWYDADGTPLRLCCFTQRDRDLVMRVITRDGAMLFHEMPLLFQSSHSGRASGGGEGRM